MKTKHDWSRADAMTEEQRHAAALAAFRTSPVGGLDLSQRQALVDCQLARVSSASYLEELRGTIGADPFHGQ